MAKRDDIIAEYFNVMESMRRLSAGPHQYWQQAQQEMTRAQLGVMMMITYQNLHTVKEIADHLGISMSATTQIVNGLVDGAFLTRAMDDTDRRKVILQPTKKGTFLLKKKKKEMQKMWANMFIPLTNTELQKLVSLHKKILSHFYDNPSTEQSTYEKE